MVDIIIGPRDGNNCCICCGGDVSDPCYCNCCACPAGSCMQFSIVRCEVWESDGSPAPTNDTCCEEMSFTMTKRPDECWAHHNAGECTYGCTMDRKGDSTVWPEMWGYSGTVCTSCTTDAPPMHQSNCEGACITASLCCCKTGNVDSEGDLDGTCHPVEIRPCPQSLDYPPNSTLECDMGCFYFEMRGYNCYATGCGPGTDMSCSCCARRDKPDCGGCTYTWDEWSAVWNLDSDDCDTTTCPVTECQEPEEGGDFDGEQKTVGCTDDIYAVHYGSFEGGCAQPIGGQCKAAGSSPPKLFSLLVEGEYLLDCDCQTGLYDADVGVTDPVRVHFTGIITEC